MNLVRRFQSYKNKASVFALALTTLVGLSAVVALPKASAAGDCSGNSVMTCGYSTPADFINKVKANNDGHGHGDLQAIYRAFGLESNIYDRFASKARSGVLYRDGRIVVDGQEVGNSANTFGRYQSYHSGPGMLVQGGIYGNTPSRTFSPSLSSLPVDAMFDNDGTTWVVVLRDCGNPVTFNPVRSSGSCNAINKTAVPGKANTYSFTTSASVSGNAKIAKVIYNFGDGTPEVSESNPAAAVTHTFSNAKTTSYKVSVRVVVSLPGAQTKEVTAAGCATTVDVIAATYECVKLAYEVVDKAKFSYKFTVTAKVGGNAKFSSADFTFGDGTSQKAVVPTGMTAVASHVYPKDGDYLATATLNFDAGGVAKSIECKTLVTLAPLCPYDATLPKDSPNCKKPVCEFNPQLPADSPDCKKPVCQYNPQLPPDSPDCKAPVAGTLVNTGPGSIAAIVAGVAALGAFLYRQFVYKRKRTAMAAAMLGQHSLTDVAEPSGPDHTDEMVESLSSKTDVADSATTAPEVKHITVSDDKE